MHFGFYLILFSLMALTGCSLVTTPISVAGGVAGATVKATGGVAAAGMQAMGRDSRPTSYQMPPAQPAPAYPQPQPQGYYYQQPYPQQPGYPPQRTVPAYPSAPPYPYAVPPQQPAQGYWYQGVWYPYALQR